MAETDRQAQRVWSATLAHTVIKPQIIVLMGVSGSGKSTVAALLAAALGCQFQEGDDLHPRANVEKMRGGTALTDADRVPWLRKIAEQIDGWRARGECGVLTCSALKRSYRNIAIGDRRDVVLVYLKGSRDLIGRRMAARHEHFMPVRDIGGAHARRAPGHSRYRWQTGRDRPRDRASARGAVASNRRARASRPDQPVTDR